MKVDESQFGRRFTKFHENPLSIPNYNAVGAVHPDVIHFPDGHDGYRYWMYYTPYPPDSEENPCLVRSNDGINFMDAGVSNPLVSRGEAVHLADPDIIKIGDTWYMYYTRRYDEEGVIHYVIDLAMSSDGKRWMKYSNNPILKQTEDWEIHPRFLSVAEPTLYYEGNYFWMWYTGGDHKIGLAKSSDGKNWAKQNNTRPVLEGTPGERDEEGMNHPDVISYKGRFWMYYVEWSQPRPRKLGLATSIDKINWEKYPGSPVLVGEEERWDKSIYRSSPVIVNGAMKLYYSAFSGRKPQIGLAVSSQTESRM